MNQLKRVYRLYTFKETLRYFVVGRAKRPIECTKGVFLHAKFIYNLQNVEFDRQALDFAESFCKISLISHFHHREAIGTLKTHGMGQI